MGLGYLGSGGPVVNHSVVAGTEDTQLYMGLLGLKPEPTNFTSMNDPQPSFMQLLKAEGLVPSLSYSYTAGAPYRSTKALGSLILGGYDQGLYHNETNTSTSSFKFLSDQSKDLTVGIQDISANMSNAGPSPLLPSGLISAYIDSSIAEIWLPIDACRAFEKAFGLEYDKTAGRYFVSDALHTKLLKINPAVKFAITTAITGGDSFTIEIPYAGFDLSLQPPLVSSTTRYFPLMRAANDTQYTLGRTFLQEAYVIVDYERSSFRVHQRAWSPTPTPTIITIPTPTTVSPHTTTTTTGTKGGEKPTDGGRKPGLSTGVVIAISVTVTVVVFFFIIIAFWCCCCVIIPKRKLREKQEKTSEGTPEVTDKPELDVISDIKSVSDVTSSPYGGLSELHSSSPASEVPGVTVPRELEAVGIYEMMGSEVPEVSATTPYPRPTDSPKSTDTMPYPKPRDSPQSTDTTPYSRPTDSPAATDSPKMMVSPKTTVSPKPPDSE